MIKKYVALTIAGLLTFILPWLAAQDLLRGIDSAVIVRLPRNVENTPAGGIYGDRVVSQEIDLTETLFEELDERTTESAFVTVLMATYARSNDSTYTFSLSQGQVTFSMEFSAADVRDNSLMTFTIPKEELLRFKPGTAVVDLFSRDAIPGNALTVWLTKDTSNGSIADTSWMNLPFDTQILMQTPRTEMVPAGALIEGVRIRQRIPGTETLRSELIALNPDYTVCLDVLAATYARTNEGEFNVVVIGGESTISRTVDSETLIDNAFVSMCAPVSDWLSIVEDGEWFIEILSSSTRTAHAPTIWLTSDISNGIVSINDTEQERSVVFSLRVEEDMRVAVSSVFSLGVKQRSVGQSVVLNLFVVIFTLFSVFMIGLLLYCNSGSLDSMRDFDHSLASLALSLGVRDEATLRNIFPPEEKLLDNYENELEFGIPVFRQKEFGNLGRKISEKLVYGNSLATGHVDRISEIENEELYVKVEGWFYDFDTDSSEENFYLVNNVYEIVGMAIGLKSRPDVARHFGNSRAEYSGYVGYLLSNEKNNSFAVVGENTGKYILNPDI